MSDPFADAFKQIFEDTQAMYRAAGLLQDPEGQELVQKLAVIEHRYRRLEEIGIFDPTPSRIAERDANSI